MKKVFCFLFTLLLGVAVLASAQKKGEKAKKETRLDARVVMINKDTSTITVRERRTNVQRQVVYNASTKYTDRDNKPAKLEDIKDGRRVIAVGKWNEKTQLVADTISIRE